MKFLKTLQTYLQKIWVRKRAQTKRLTKVFTPQENVFLKETDRTLERVFLWRVSVIAFLGLFFFSFVPYISISSVSATPPVTLENDISESLIFNTDDGFLMKPEIWTNEEGGTGNRDDVGDIITHTIESRETISGIAKKYGITTRTILQNNGFLNPKSIKSGMKLKIPAVNGLIHSIKKGDTISKIAEKYKIDPERILAQNNIDSEESIYEGQEIIIPGIKKQAPKIEPKPTPSGSNSRIASANTNVNAHRNKPANISFANDTKGKLLFPTQGTYTQYYRYGHYAVDIAKGGGAPIYAAESGKVIKAASGWNGGYGNVVIIDHGSGMKTLYAHFRDIYVQPGQTVSRGEPIGYMGTTGRSTGVHLHFEVVVNGAKKNPIAYF